MVRSLIVSLLDLVTSNESVVSNLLVIVSSTCPRVVLNIARNSLIQTMQTPAANLYATATTWLTQIQVVLALVKLFRFSNFVAQRGLVYDEDGEQVIAP